MIYCLIPECIGSLLSKFVSNKPIPDTDIRFIAWCKACDIHAESHVTRGGRYGLLHCYGCGHESPMFQMNDRDWEQSRVSSYSYWKKYPRIPYNWHTLSESEKLAILKW